MDLRCPSGRGHGSSNGVWKRPAKKRKRGKRNYKWGGTLEKDGKLEPELGSDKRHIDECRPKRPAPLDLQVERLEVVEDGKIGTAPRNNSPKSAGVFRPKIKNTLRFGRGGTTMVKKLE